MQKTIDLIYICYWAHLFANRITKSSTVANDANTNAHFNLSSYSFGGVPLRLLPFRLLTPIEYPLRL